MEMADIAQALWGTGLMVRGGFHPDADDLVPDTSGSVGSVVIVGNAGGAMWRAFSAAPEATSGGADPLDAWTRRVLTDVARDLGAGVAFPFGGPPYLPFQRWAQKADTVYPSPIGPLIHPRYGLWHAYRGALLIAARLDLPTPPAASDPCADCTDKPCLHTCPVAAFTADGYAVPRCLAHIAAPEGAECMERGCAARRACPVGRSFHYDPAQAAFHQNHFLASNRRSADDAEPGF